MMLTNPLPDSVEIDGEHYKVITDFAEWIKFEMLIDDPEFTDDEKAALMIQWYDCEPPQDYGEAINALVWFFRCGTEIEDGNGKQSPKVYDYDQDAQLIYAAFLQAYNIDLSNGLHWWAFRACLAGMPESTRLAQIMGIRGVDMDGMSQRERQHYKKLQALCAIKGDTPKTLEDRDAAYLAKVAKRKN